MPLESWIKPEEATAMAAEAVSHIDAALSRLPTADREAFWSSIRKCYNTPYNDPKPRKLDACRIVSGRMEVSAAAVESRLPASEFVANTIPEPEVSIAMAAIPVSPTFVVDNHAA